LPGPPPELEVDALRVPFLPAPSHASYDGSGAITVINRTALIGEEIDWGTLEHGPLWAYHLHQFDHLRCEGVAPRARTELMLDWVARHVAGVGWDPHPTSLRILSWSKLLLTPGALDLDEAESATLRLSLARQIETLSVNLEVRLQANHLFSNLLGVVFGGVVFGGVRSRAWLAFAELLDREVEEQILPDGGHIERSPMYHALLLENVLDLINVAQSAEDRLPLGTLQALEAAAARMLGALRLWLHPDGEIALFADSALGIAQPASALERYAALLAIEPRGPWRGGVLRNTGYVRLEAEPFTLIASVMGPSPSYQPGHAHCDALAFELSCGTERVVTDTGVCEYVPGPRRDQSRSTRAHATMQVGGAEQAEIWAAHRVGGRPVVNLEWVDPSKRVVATCRGWSTPDSEHRRVFSVREQAIEIADALEGRRRPVRLALPLAPGLEPRLAHDQDGGTEAHIPLSSGRRLRIALPAAASWRIERAPYYPEFGVEVARACLVGESDDFETGTWRFDLVD
jgi:uncharacterized heparinase superfamily protein